MSTEIRKLELDLILIFTDIHTAQGIKSARAIYKEKDGVYLSDHDAVRIDWELIKEH